MERFKKDGIPEPNEKVSLPGYEQSIISDDLLMEEIEFEQGRTDGRESGYFPRQASQSIRQSRAFGDRASQQVVGSYQD